MNVVVILQSKDFTLKKLLVLNVRALVRMKSKNKLCTFDQCEIYHDNYFED